LLAGGSVQALVHQVTLDAGVSSIVDEKPLLVRCIERCMLKTALLVKGDSVQAAAQQAAMGAGLSLIQV
jgi:hypothetical protein